MRVAARIQRLLLALALGEYRRYRSERFPPVMVPITPLVSRSGKGVCGGGGVYSNRFHRGALETANQPKLQKHLYFVKFVRAGF